MDQFAFPIVLLAAGASRRMRGCDKLLEKVHGKPLVRQQALRARHATKSSVLVTLPPAPHPRYDALSDLAITPVPVQDVDEGINASLRQALAALPPDASCVMILLADLPDLTTADMCEVAAAVDPLSDNLIWRGATAAGKGGHPIVFHRTLFENFAALTGDSGGKEVIAAAQGRIALIPLQGNRALLDLDTPEDWATWRAAQ